MLEKEKIVTNHIHYILNKNSMEIFQKEKQNNKVFQILCLDFRPQISGITKTVCK